MFTGCAAPAVRHASIENPSRVRKGEYVTLQVFQKKAENKRPTEKGAGTVLAAAAISEVIKFASSELQNYLEAVAALHTAEYTATAVVKDFDPAAETEVHLVRYVKDSNNTPVVAARMVYRLESTGQQTNSQHLIAIGRDDSRSFVQFAAAQLDSTSTPFDADVTITFAFVEKKASAPSGGVQEDDGGVDPPREDTTPKNAKNENSSALVEQTVIDKIRPTVAEGSFQPANLPANAPSSSDFELVSTSNVGVVTAPAQNSALRLTLKVVEKDPSRAAERNRAAKNALETLTPDLIKYLQERSGVKPQS
jgi:hypothetical protein